MDNTPQPPGPDDLTNAADNVTHGLEGASDGVADIADNLTQALEDGLNTAEQKLDAVTGWLDKFLGKP